MRPRPAPPSRPPRRCSSWQAQRQPCPRPASRSRRHSAPPPVPGRPRSPAAPRAPPRHPTQGLPHPGQSVSVHPGVRPPRHRQPSSDLHVLGLHVVCSWSSPFRRSHTRRARCGRRTARLPEDRASEPLRRRHRARRRRPRFVSFFTLVPQVSAVRVDTNFPAGVRTT